MSWQSYVDDQLVATKMVKHAVICGHDGNIWAQSAGFTVSAVSSTHESDSIGRGGVGRVHFESVTECVRPVLTDFPTALLTFRPAFFRG